MTLFRFALAAAAMAGFAMPAVAQQQTTPPSPANQAANVREQPVTDALNAGVQQHLETQAAITADQQAQYDLDRAAYRAAVKARAAVVGQDTARAMRQEDAYARAMIVWRIQTDECNRGILKSCKKPTPVPADYY
ncbi:hypothetical protein [Sphingomonas solaris]|uniref:Uncharacterized protein n=1 Tax=Alterirhizorhabdus solaris TaxID=2529389 RepID=A0A558QSE2_9SPHN|nr:hypothetical protein [Sphingomonas solaris]TVV70024.1 hypothetical protein FOY91_20095 [Sphingomonas solaris]